MNQDDFRKVVATHSLANTSLLASAAAGGRTARDGDTSAAAAKRKERKHVQPLRKKKDADADASKPAVDAAAASGYRDRAKERRVTEAQLVPDAAAEEERMYESIDYESSKFMGGDLAHTHLVKGLDFALLQKLRAEQEAVSSAPAAPQPSFPSLSEAAARFVALCVAADASIARSCVDASAYGPAAVAAREAMWKEVETMAESTWKRRRRDQVEKDRFGPWRTTYDIKCVDAAHMDEVVHVPDAVLHAEADVDVMSDCISCPIPSSLLTRIADVMQRSAVAVAAPVAPAPPPVAQLPRPVVQDDDDDDIFAGAGVYTDNLTVIPPAVPAARPLIAPVMPPPAPVAAPPARSHMAWQDDAPAEAVTGVRRYATLDEYERALARKGTWRRDEEEDNSKRKRAKLDGQLKQIQRKIDERKAGVAKAAGE